MKLSDPSFVTTPQAACVSLYGTEPKESRPDLLHFLIFSALTQNNRAEATWRGGKKMKQEREMGEDEEKVIKEPRRGEKRWVNVQKSKDEKKQNKKTAEEEEEEIISHSGQHLNSFSQKNIKCPTTDDFTTP